MTSYKSSSRASAQNDQSAERLFAKLSLAGRRRSFEMQLAEEFPAFVMKVFETVSGGDVFLPNWHIDAMTYRAQRVIDGKLKRLIVTVPPRHLKSIIFRSPCPLSSSAVIRRSASFV